MRNTLLLFGSIALTVLCWGVYGPVLRFGQQGMSTADFGLALLRPFVCVGLAYFLIGVLVAGLWLYFRGEKGDWTPSGIIWSLAGGAVGAIGALGIVLAFKFGGRPVYVMPLVFGGAPVVNAFLTIYLARRVKEIGPWFLAGLIMVVLGAVTVLLFAPHPAPHAAAANVTIEGGGFWSGASEWVARLLAIALTIVCWGSYGPVLHRGQAAMHHSRMRPMVCVGLAYFLIAVIVPNIILAEFPEASSYWHSFSGTMMALAGGAVGAVGALGIIFAFNFGGRPVFVMPLVFGGAPVINTLYTISTMWSRGEPLNISPMFFAGLILVVAGAVMVLVLAPRGEKTGQVPIVKGSEPQRATAPAPKSHGS
jgi:hypothetical protein